MRPEVVGLKPWFPWPFCRWRWWSSPVPAERLAIFRIALAAVLIVDVATTYIPACYDFFGVGALGTPYHKFKSLDDGDGSWSLVAGMQTRSFLLGAMYLWLAAAVGLFLGLFTRLCAITCWALAISFGNMNTTIDNAGDSIRTIFLFYLMLCPSGVVWSLDSLRQTNKKPRYVYPWPLRLLFVQMIFIYFCNGVHKATGVDWTRGDSLYFVLGDWTLARFSYAQFPIPYTITKALTWIVLYWELSFPVLMVWRPVRICALLLGACFHLGIWVSMELGFFPPYMLCFYLTFLPWERWVSGKNEQTSTPAIPLFFSPDGSPDSPPAAPLASQVGRVAQFKETAQ
jgi:hypothetical protein